MKVRRIIENFNSNTFDTTPKKSLKFDDNDADQMETHKKDAFKFLMGARGGDTQRKTPVRRKVKRLENHGFTKSGEKYLDLQNWVRNDQKN